MFYRKLGEPNKDVMFFEELIFLIQLTNTRRILIADHGVTPVHTATGKFEEDRLYEN